MEGFFNRLASLPRTSVNKAKKKGRSAMPRPSLVAVPDRTGTLRSVYGGVAKQNGVVARDAVEGAAVIADKVGALYVWVRQGVGNPIAHVVIVGVAGDEAEVVRRV